MNDKFFVGLKLTALEDNGIRKPVSRVTLLVDDDNALTAGDDTGTELVADCPHATQEMVNSLLESLKGYQYRAYRADDTSIDPAAELGDGVTVGGIYSVVSQISDDGSGYSGLTAPGEAELEDEYPSGGPMTQAFDRKIATTRSIISKTAEEIRFEVGNDIDQVYTIISIKNGEINSKIEDEVNGLHSEITQTAESINSRINREVSGLSSEITQTAESINTRITSEVGGLESEITFTASSLTAQITATDGRVTSLTADLDKIETRVEDAEGNITTLTQTATSLQSQVDDNKGNITTLTQTANSLQIQVTNNKNSISSVQQYAESITLSVSNGSTSSVVTLKAGSTTISSYEITMDGLVTFTGLRNGDTVINGACIRTGTIDAQYLNLRGAITFSDLSSGVQDNISGAYDAAEIANENAYLAYELASENKVPDYIKSTYIDITTIRSPTIEANDFGVYSDGSGGSFSLYGYWSERYWKVFTISYSGSDYPVVNINSPDGAAVYFNADVHFTGTVDIPGVT